MTGKRGLLPVLVGVMIVLACGCGGKPRGPALSDADWQAKQTILATAGAEALGLFEEHRAAMTNFVKGSGPWRDEGRAMIMARDRALTAYDAYLHFLKEYPRKGVDVKAIQRQAEALREFQVPDGLGRRPLPAE